MLEELQEEKVRYVNNLNGELKDTKLYNRALSAAEVKNFAQEPGAPVIKYGYPAMSVKDNLLHYVLPR